MMIQHGMGREVILDQLMEYLDTRLLSPEKALVQEFTRRFYAYSPEEDLAAHTVPELAGMVLSHWRFLQERRPGETRIRVFNPVPAEDGWQSTHTILQVSDADMPFLVDSIRMELWRQGFQIYYTVHFGGLRLKRDAGGQVTEMLSPATHEKGVFPQAIIYAEIDRQTEPAVMERIRAAIERVLADVHLAVSDWHAIKEKVEDSLQSLQQCPPPLDADETEESCAFLRWLANNHFTFLGCRDYHLTGRGAKRILQPVLHSGLGVLRDDRPDTEAAAVWQEDRLPSARQLVLLKNILVITKTSILSTVHRRAYMDCIGVKFFNAKGELAGERRFFGLYTSTVYYASPRHIPLLRHKVEQVIGAFHFPPDSHYGKEVVHILETLPRDELFQATTAELTTLTQGILHLQERRMIRVFVRPDPFGQYFSCMVYAPADICNAILSQTMQDILMQAFQGIDASFSTWFADPVLARIHFLIRVDPARPVKYDVSHIEYQLRSAASSWTDALRKCLVEQFGEGLGLKYHTKYRKAFPASYTEQYLPRTAIEDIRKIELLSAQNPLEMLFYKSGTTTLQLKLFHTEHTIALSDVLPTLENMGMRVFGEQPHQVIFQDGNIAWISDFDMAHASRREIEVDNIRDIFQEAFNRIWFREAEDDGFNQLVIEAGLTWHEIAVLRGYTHYLRQTGFTFSQNYIEQALVNNAPVARQLIQLFRLRFSPEYGEALPRPATDPLVAQIEHALESVVSLDEDRIIRRLLEVILATLRTSYFQTTAEGYFKSHISFKLDPSAISDLPLPRPVYEIFVYSPRVEGVHLRAGKVARGGLRWSDRREDFRTEVLGLMKAQQVKNSVIVPVGAKGGFYARQLPSDGNRDAIMQEGIYCYTTFIRGLLDVTDNIQDGRVVTPRNVVRYDDDDPYLVVAADKGTATFSDIANGVAAEYGFWLGDAFASGGSAGYDHKKMGITARGAWESVKRHFRELGLNPAKNDFTVIGIGDMGGDVFGNGMLLSPHIRLVAAWNHQHIFVDPVPNAAASLKERQRLFSLPRSSWMDYNPALISTGGGIFSRAAKLIQISPEMKTVFGIEANALVPNDLIRAILKAPVDLLWNGGIGTFVKAATESHADVGDRNNDGIRVDGAELKARVVCEGGNLGLTQLGRVEYSLAGGVIYTDFIDNSAGVDCSDHEVNLKILLNPLVAEGKITPDERNLLLQGMTDEVAALVLRDNYEQTQILSLEASVAAQTMDLFRRYMNELERRGGFDRRLACLPDENAMVERRLAGQPLTRPEIATMISFCKMFLKQDILVSDVPEDPWFLRYLAMAFPASLRERYLPQMQGHILKREIVSTQLAKRITDRMGVNFVERLQRETGAAVAFVVRAWAIAESIYDTEVLWHQIEALDYQVNVAVQNRMFLQVYYLVRRTTRWILRNRKPNLDIDETIGYFSASVRHLWESLPELLTGTDAEDLAQKIAVLVTEGVPEQLASRLAGCSALFTSLDIVEAALKYDLPVREMAKTYYALGTRLELDWIREQMNAYPIDNLWDELARSGFRDDLDRAQRKLGVSVMLHPAVSPTGSVNEKIDAWLAQSQMLTGRWQNLLTDVRTNPNAGFVTYSVILRELFDFAQAGQ